MECAPATECLTKISMSDDFAKRAFAQIDSFISDHPEYSRADEKQPRQGATNRVVFGRRGEKPVVFKVFCQGERKERECFAYGHWGKTDLIPKLLEVVDPDMIVTTHVSGNLMKSDRVFIAAFPKAGSSFVTNVLCDYTGYGERKYAEPGMHKDLVIQRLKAVCGEPHIVKQHTIALPKNLELMHKFEIRPVVLVRNIFDGLVSLNDYLPAMDRDNFLMPNLEGRSPEERLRATVLFCAPFYIQFYVSWWRAEKSGFPVCWVSYEEMLSDKTGFFERIIEFCDIPLEERLSESIAKCDVKSGNRIKNANRFNVGIAGRGEQIDGELRQHIHGLCSFFPEVDFSLIGIQNPGKNEAREKR